MSLFLDYLSAINSLKNERLQQDEINYRNWQNDEAGKQKGIKALTSAAAGAALMYAFPPAGMMATPGKAALLGGGLGLLGGTDVMALPYIANRGTPTPMTDTGSGSLNLNPYEMGNDKSLITPRTPGYDVNNIYNLQQFYKDIGRNPRW